MCGLFCSCYRGRGAFESLGAGIPMSPGDIAFKSNFATMDLETGIVEKRRADRNFEEAGPVLCDALNGMGNTINLFCSVCKLPLFVAVMQLIFLHGLDRNKTPFSSCHSCGALSPDSINPFFSLL